MRPGLEVDRARVGQRVRTTDTKRWATIIELRDGFDVALIRYDNAADETWWPLSSLEPVTTTTNAGSGS